MNDLKPCPLCGSAAHLSDYDGVVKHGHTLRFVACTNQRCLCSVFDESDDAVIKRWNQRVNNA